jgi:hypothetical protein
MTRRESAAFAVNLGFGLVVVALITVILVAAEVAATHGNMTPIDMAAASHQ